MNKSDMKEAMMEAIREIDREKKKSSISPLIDTSSASSGVITKSKPPVSKEQIGEIGAKLKSDIESPENISTAASGTVTIQEEFLSTITEKNGYSVRADEKNESSFQQEPLKMINDTEEEVEGLRESPKMSGEITQFEIELLQTLNSLNTTLRVSVFFVITIWLIKTLWRI